MPKMFKVKSLAAQRKKNAARALGTRIKPTGRIRRQAPVQLMKRTAVTNMGRAARDTGKFRVKDYRLPQAARERVLGTKMVDEEQQVKDQFGYPKFKETYKRNMWGGMSLGYAPETIKVSVPKQYEVSPARPAVQGKIDLKRISQSHNNLRSSGAGKQKTFGGIAANGKRGSFQSRKSKRRA